MIAIQIFLSYLILTIATYIFCVITLASRGLINLPNDQLLIRLRTSPLHIRIVANATGWILYSSPVVSGVCLILFVWGW